MVRISREDGAVIVGVNEATGDVEVRVFGELEARVTLKEKTKPGAGYTCSEDLWRLLFGDPANLPRILGNKQ